MNEAFFRRVAVILTGVLVVPLTVMAASQQEIAAAVKRLGADDFKTREQASRFLWETNARQAVEQASRSDDPEIAFRARQVLAKLESGIRPDTPPAIRALIEEFDQATPARKQAIITELYHQGTAGRQFLLLIARKTNSLENRAVLFYSLLEEQLPALFDDPQQNEAREREIDDVLFWMEVFPEDMTLALETISGLDRAGRKQQADRVFERSYALQEQLCRSGTQKAQWHNNAAWLCAVTKRRLDDGLRHAQRAIALAPGEPAYLDTLAEIRFQLGHRAEAIQLLEECIQIDPDLQYYRDQLARIKNGDRNSRPPEP